jgi:RNA polymerase sigma factor (TIGR02999 family)
MSDVSRLLCAIDGGEPSAAEQLLPLVYTELRRLAAGHMARENAGQTLDPTALVHEAYLRLVDKADQRHFANRRHFFAVAAEAMRHILVERARRKKRQKRGGNRRRVDLKEALLPLKTADGDILAVDEALKEFAKHDPDGAELVKLHFFAGLKIDDAAQLLGISSRTAYRNWSFARAWLYEQLGGDKPDLN